MRDRESDRKRDRDREEKKEKHMKIEKERNMQIDENKFSRKREREREHFCIHASVFGYADECVFSRSIKTCVCVIRCTCVVVVSVWHSKF